MRGETTCPECSAPVDDHGCTTADPARAQRMEELLWEVLTGVDDDFDGFSYVRDDILRFFGRDPDTEPWPSVREEADGTE